MTVSAKGEEKSISHMFWIFVISLFILMVTQFMRKTAGIGKNYPNLVNGIFQIESGEYDRQKHQYTRQQVLELKQSKDYKKMISLQGGKKTDKWDNDE